MTCSRRHEQTPSALTTARICIIVYTMLFLWDDAKERSNRRKHGIGFDTAAAVFLDPFHITRQDRVVDGEERWQIIGMAGGIVLILAAYTVVDEEKEVIRIISARRAIRQERIVYEEAREI
jgi:uncharacterized protein